MGDWKDGKLPFPIFQPSILSTLTNYTKIDIAKEIKPALIQLHNDISVDEIKKIKKALKKIKITKTINVNKKALDEAKKFEPYVDYLLLDTAVKGKKGGTGKTHNWDISAEIVRKIKKPVFLAGGLNPDNVSEAVGKVKPYAVDVNSGAFDRALVTLTEIDLLEPDAYLDVRFSKAGIRLGKKLLARWEG